MPGTFPSNPPILRSWNRALHVSCGLACTGLAVVGILLPIVPATPFLLVASACFARSSPRLQRWLLRSPVLGKLLHDWEVRGGVTHRVKALAVVVALGGAAFTIGSGLLSFGACLGAGLVAAVGLVVVARLPLAR